MARVYERRPRATTGLGRSPHKAVPTAFYYGPVFLDGSRRRRRRWPLFALLAVLIGGGVATAAYFAFFQKPGNVSHPNAEFNVAPPPRKQKLATDTFKWPVYGYTKTRTRYLNAKLRPPFKQLWEFSAGPLIEVQPILIDGVLYFSPNDGTVFALRAKDGKQLWKEKVGDLNASAPTYDHGRIFVVTMSANVTALRAKDGKRLWGRGLSAPSESSPVVIGDLVCFGSQDGTVYGLRVKDGSTAWTYHTGGSVKGGLAYDNGNLYFGDYSGNVTAIRAKDGSRVWSTGTSGRAFQQSGEFYSTPAVANGRVYLGNTDGFVYSFTARDGQLAWRHGTGAYVYSSAAVGPGPNGTQTVFIGGYDRTFYALDARSGNVLWAYSAPGRISGAPTLIGDVVYFADLDTKSTTGLDAKTGRQVFSFNAGIFNPVISDGKRIYLTGFGREFAFEPQKSAPKLKPPPKLVFEKNL